MVVKKVPFRGWHSGIQVYRDPYFIPAAGNIPDQCRIKTD
eukprot:SAG11_NODE_17895_length_506_cov_0.884521_2_plen_39_part_01